MHTSDGEEDGSAEGLEEASLLGVGLGAGEEVWSLKSIPPPPQTQQASLAVLPKFWNPEPYNSQYDSIAYHSHPYTSPSISNQPLGSLIHGRWTVLGLAVGTRVKLSLARSNAAAAAWTMPWP